MDQIVWKTEKQHYMGIIMMLIKREQLSLPCSQPHVFGSFQRLLGLDRFPRHEFTERIKIDHGEQNLQVCGRVLVLGTLANSLAVGEEVIPRDLRHHSSFSWLSSIGKCVLLQTGLLGTCSWRRNSSIMVSNRCSYSYAFGAYVDSAAVEQGKNANAHLGRKRRTGWWYLKQLVNLMTFLAIGVDAEEPICVSERSNGRVGAVRRAESLAPCRPQHASWLRTFDKTLGASLPRHLHKSTFVSPSDSFEMDSCYYCVRGKDRTLVAESHKPRNKRIGARNREQHLIHFCQISESREVSLKRRPLG